MAPRTQFDAPQYLWANGNTSSPVHPAMGASISSFELTGIERLALEVATPEESIDELADWIRAYLRREIERRLRAETNGHENFVQIACAKCGDLYTVGWRTPQRMASNGRTLCRGLQASAA